MEHGRPVSPTHYNDVMMGAISSLITSLTIVYSTGEFPTQRPVTRTFDVFFDLRPNKHLSKQSRGWWFEMPPCSLWRHCNEHLHVFIEIPFVCVAQVLIDDASAEDPLNFSLNRFQAFTWNRGSSRGIILSIGSANGRRRYYVTPPLIGRAHTQNDHCLWHLSATFA